MLADIRSNISINTKRKLLSILFFLAAFFLAKLTIDHNSNTDNWIENNEYTKIYKQINSYNQYSLGDFFSRCFDINVDNVAYIQQNNLFNYKSQQYDTNFAQYLNIDNDVTCMDGYSNTPGNSHTFIVKSGDTLLSILNGININRQDIYNSFKSLGKYINVNKLKIGQTVEILTNSDHNKIELKSLSIYIDHCTKIIATKRENGEYESEKIIIPIKEIVSRKNIRFNIKNIDYMFEKYNINWRVVHAAKRMLDTAQINYTCDIDCIVTYRTFVLENDLQVQNAEIMKLEIISNAHDNSPNTTIYNINLDGRNVFANTQGKVYKDIVDRVLAKPLKQCTVTSHFGKRYHPVYRKILHHNGADFYAPIGTTIYASAAGTVVQCGFASGYGKYIKIKHNGGLCTTYAHLSKIFVSNNQIVQCGDVIGLSGNTGRTTGPHLHYEVMKNGQYVNPLDRIIITSKDEYVPIEQIRNFDKMIQRQLELNTNIEPKLSMI